MAGWLRKIGRVVLDVVVVTAILIFIPGLPPYMAFKSFSNTPARKLEGQLAPNHYKLDKSIAILKGEILGPESIAVRKNELYTGLIGGSVIKIVDGKQTFVAKFGQDCEGKWEETKCGRPLGMRFAPDGSLIVLDAYYGMFKVDVDTGAVVNLVSTNDTIEGRKPMIPNDLDIATDGTIYWSDSSTHSHLQDSLDEFLGEASGRLIKYNPKTKISTVLLTGIRFANGVQLSKNEDFVIVSDAGHARVLKYYLKGSKEGSSEVFIDGLPGNPDNIRSNGKGGFYISLTAPRYAEKASLLDTLGPLPYLRKFILRIVHLIKLIVHAVNFVLPNFYFANAEYYIGHLEPVAKMLPKHAIIIEVDQEGQIIKSFHGSSKVHHISEMTLDEKREFGYLGSPYNNEIWKISIKYLEHGGKPGYINL